MSSAFAAANMLDGHDLDELDALLAAIGNEQSLGLDGVHGLLSALAVGPADVNAEDWLALALGEDPRIVEHPQVDRCVELLLALRASIDYSLQHFAYEPVFMEHASEDGDDCELDYSGWCMGFAVGVDLLAEEWEVAMGDADLAQATAIVYALGASAELFQRCLAAPTALTDEEHEDLVRQLPARLLDIKQYWEDDRHAQPPIRHSLH